MQKNLRLAAVVTAALLALPTVGYADSSAASSSASRFSWFANTPSPVTVQARANARAQLVINTSKTWVCSPSGFGKRSTCVAG